jgi:hydrogenase maturation protein HypF
VGFRPFVYRLATRHGVTGSVQNHLGKVAVLAQGEPQQLAAFGRALVSEAPPLAQPAVLEVRKLPLSALHEFRILPSCETMVAEIHVPPDYFTCDDCLAELLHPRDRRYRYPFINCTQCGPRYTLIRRLPYDRPNTAMARFALCQACRAEYLDPLDRRFHAEPVACPRCGPELQFIDSERRTASGSAAALTACVAALQGGGIVAVKGVGGYHLMCDAQDEAAVARLRARKPRPDKPLAVMFPFGGEDGLSRVRAAVKLTQGEAELLLSPLRPIVLATKAPASSLCAQIAPGLGEVGVMLPYSPLHHLILHDYGKPVVATSGNLSGEPVLTDNAEVDSRLGHVIDAALHHNRPIVRPADDPLFRTIGGAPRPLRLGRGCAPREITLPFRLPLPLLAVGAHMRNTVTLAWERRAVISPHIGDMHSPRSVAVFASLVESLQSLYQIRAEAVVCDRHPSYTTSRWAEQCGLAVHRVLHHHAHASALVGEYPGADDWLVFTWDGLGFGADGSLWGGEAFAGAPGQWRRVGTMRSFCLPGGERAGREPWRAALALCWELNLPWQGAPAETVALHQAWQRRVNAPPTTAVGRLFDGAAALVGLCQHSSYEGQAPMLLEAACSGPGEAIALPLARDADGLWQTDWGPLIHGLLADQRAPGVRAADFHASLAQALLAQALRVRESHAVGRVGLCGGVFQNRWLVQRATDLLRAHGFSVCLPQQIPANDGGISFGQAIEVGAALV